MAMKKKGVDDEEKRTVEEAEEDGPSGGDAESSRVTNSS